MAKGQKATYPSASSANNDKTPTKQSGKGKFKLSKKQIGIIGAVVAVLVMALVAMLVLVLGRRQPQAGTNNKPDIAEITQAVDYKQKITSEDGSEFKAEYQAGSEQSFAMRFSDLKCEDNCKNVSEVKLGNKILKKGEDYEVKSGSIIIILTESLMKSLKAEKYDLVIAVVDDNKTLFYGVKFTIKPEPTCDEGETLEKGECVKKPEEQPSQNNQQGSNTTTKPSTQPSKPSQQPSQPQQPAQPTTPSKSQAEIECENKTGPMSFTAVHWTSGSEYTDAYMSGSMGMHWINGVCRPNVSGALGNLYGRGFGSEGMPVYDGTDPTIRNNQGQDIIIWSWGDGSRTVDKVPSAFNVWKY